MSTRKQLRFLYKTCDFYLSSLLIDRFFCWPGRVKTVHCYKFNDISSLKISRLDLNFTKWQFTQEHPRFSTTKYFINQTYEMQWRCIKAALFEKTSRLEPSETIVAHSSTMLGEFYVFATELARFCEQGAAVPMSTSHSLHSDGQSTNYKTGSKRMAYEVFLGGSCNPTTWRSDIAIPALQKLGITYYNPQVSEWTPELIAQEYEAKQTARVLFFVIDNQTRNTAGIMEAAQLAATRHDSLILVVYPYRIGQSILGENISMQEYYDLMNGLLVLEFLMERQRIPIFENVSDALDCTSKIIRREVSVQDLHGVDGIRSTRISLNQHGLELTTLKETFNSMDVNNTGSINLRDALIALQGSTKSHVSVSNLRNTAHAKTESYEAKPTEESSEQRINFDQFCTLAREWSWRAKSNGAYCESWNNSHVDAAKRDLYIGVVGEDQFWLESSAMPHIESMNLSVHRTSFNEYTTRNLPHELQRMSNSRLILLIVPQQSRCIAITALAAYLIGLRVKLVLCVQTLPDSCIVYGEKLSEQAIKDYNRGRMYLSDYAKREGVPVFASIPDALQHAVKLVQRPR